MRRLPALFGSLALLVALVPGPVAATADPDVVPGAYIVVLKSGDPDSVAAEHRRAHGATVAHVYRYALRGYAARMSATAAARIARDARVLSVEPDRVVAALHHVCGHVTPKGGVPCPEPSPSPSPSPDPDPEPDPSPSPEPDPAYAVPLGLQRAHWDAAALARSAPAVAVIDTGIAGHADLNVVGGTNCSSGNSYSDGNGHGTHVAGTIGAKGGIVGVAPGAPLYAVRVLNNAGSGSWSSIICGVDWVTPRANVIKVANMSLGGSGTAGNSCASSSLRQAICRSVAAGVTYVVAAGNSAADSAGFVPAAYPEVVTVAALADFDGAPGGGAAPTCRSDVDDTVANFSNYGAPVDIVAPGVCITSTWRGGGYDTISGTSMAAPHVAGAAAHYLAANPGAGPAGVQAALLAAGNDAYSFTWNGTTPVPGTKWPLLDLRGL